MQVESVAGSRRAGEIAGVPGVDALFPGAADIAVAAGLPGQSSGVVGEAVDAVLAAAAAGGLAGVVVAEDGEQAVRLQERGASVTLAVEATVALRAIDAVAGWGAPHAAQRLTPGPVVLVPGMQEDEAVWSSWAERLPRGWRPRPARIDLDASIAEMAETLLCTAPDRFVLAAHSLGGVVALEALRRAPERIRGAMLVCSPARAPAEEQVAAWDALERRVEDGDHAAVVGEQPDLVLGPHARAAPATRALVEEMARRVGPAGLRRQLAAQRGREDLRASLPAIAVPILVVSGGHDAICPPPRQEEIVELCGSATHVRIPDAGHLVPAERPAELMDAFLAWAAGPGSGRAEVHPPTA